MDSEEIRKTAIRRHLSVKSITHICQDLEVSRKWFYKWWRRYKSGKEYWFKDESKAPKVIPNKLDEEMEQLTLSIRDELKRTKYAQIGASAIAWQINKLEYKPPPYWTINRVLKRNGRIQLKQRKGEKKSNSAYLYFTDAFYLGYIQQSDLVGPRYIKADGRFYVFNTIDLFSHAVHSVPIRSKDDDSIVCALLDIWKSLGVP